PIDEGVPVEEPAHDDEEADLQRALKLKVQGKGKEKVRLPPMPTESSAHAELPSMDAKLNLTDSEIESNEEASKINARNQEEGQAGPNPGVQDEGQAGPNPGVAAESQLQSSHVVHAGPNLEHMDLGTSDASAHRGSVNGFGPPSTGTSGSAQQQGNKAPSSSKSAASTSAWTTSDTRYESAGIFETHELSPTDYLMQDDSIPEEQVLLSDDEDSENDHQPKANASVLAATYEPPAENSLLAKIRDMKTFINLYCQKVNKTVLTQADFEGQAYEVVKAFYPDVIHLQFQMEECHEMLTAQADWTNPEGDQVRIDVD
ncbi:hypothetical protein Tco_1325497, partial [Tanacetum coccineum]